MIADVQPDLSFCSSCQCCQIFIISWILIYHCSLCLHVCMAACQTPKSFLCYVIILESDCIRNGLQSDAKQSAFRVNAPAMAKTAF